MYAEAAASGERRGGWCWFNSIKMKGKVMMKLIRAAVFVLALSVGARAEGIIQYDKTQPPPPPPPATKTSPDAAEPAADGIMEYDLTVAAREVAQILLKNLLNLF